MPPARTEDEEIRLRNFRRKRLREQLAWLGVAAVIGLVLLLASYYFVELAMR
jgi:hypothetical protein